MELYKVIDAINNDVKEVVKYREDNEYSLPLHLWGETSGVLRELHQIKEVLVELYDDINKLDSLFEDKIKELSHYLEVNQDVLTTFDKGNTSGRIKALKKVKALMND